VDEQKGLSPRHRPVCIFDVLFANCMVYANEDAVTIIMLLNNFRS